MRGMAARRALSVELSSYNASAQLWECRIKTRHHVEIGPLEHCLPGSIKGRPETVVRAETLRSLRIIEGPVLPRAGYAGTLLSPEEYARCATQPRREDCAFAPGAADVHQVRDMGYGRHKQKVAAPSETPYELVCGDFVGTESRVEHIVRRMRLPRSNGIPESVGGFPRFFVVNYMLPDYAAPLLSPGDGPGRSLVLFFRLRTDFDPEVRWFRRWFITRVDSPVGQSCACVFHLHAQTFPHRQAIPLMLRFFNGEQEQNGEPSRDRLKLVARVMNLKQWGELGGLSSYQVNLLGKYNGKPVMTRPQHAFYR